MEGEIERKREEIKRIEIEISMKEHEIVDIENILKLKDREIDDLEELIRAKDRYIADLERQGKRVLITRGNHQYHERPSVVVPIYDKTFERYSSTSRQSPTRVTETL